MGATDAGRLRVPTHVAAWLAENECQVVTERFLRGVLEEEAIGSEETVIVRLTRGELEAVIIGTEASRLKPLLRPERWKDAGNAEKKLFKALRERGWNR